MRKKAKHPKGDSQNQLRSPLSEGGEPDSRIGGIAAFMTIYARADVYRFSFFPRTIITWNSIPPDVRQASTIGQFQAGLGSITLPVQM